MTEPTTEKIGTCDFCGTPNITVYPVEDLFLALPKENWQQNMCEHCEDMYCQQEDDWFEKDS